jgi:hypothetical protein
MAVGFFAHDDASAPVLTGENGAETNVLDACLVNGYGAKSALGWEIHQTGTNKRGYRSTDSAATGCVLQVLDDGSAPNGARSALWRGYETMSDVDTGSNPFPTVAQEPDNDYGSLKSQTLDSTARPWWIIGDEMFFYMITAFRSRDYVEVTYFGDLADSRKSGDAWPCVIGADRDCDNYNQNEGYNTAVGRGTVYSTAAGPGYIARAHTQSVGSVALGHWTWNGSHPGQAGFDYPHPVEGGLLLSAPRLVESGTYLRGTLPGLYAPWHQKPVSHLSIIDDVDELSGRYLLALRTYGPNNVEGQVLIDMTGPWR